MLKKYFDNYELNDIEDVSSERAKALSAQVITRAGADAPARRGYSRGVLKAVRIAAICAAAASCFAITAGAVYNWNYGKLLSAFFPRAVTDVAAAEETDSARSELSEKPAPAAASEPVPELIEEAARKLDGMMIEIPESSVVSTFRYYDVTFDGAVFDGERLMLLTTFRSKDGSPITADPAFIDSFAELCSDSGVTFRPDRSGLDFMDDGSLRLRSNHIVSGEITEPINVTATVSYLTCGGSLKKPQDISAEPEDTVLDDGVASAVFTLAPPASPREFILTNESGETVTAYITPISAKVCFEPFNAAGMSREEIDNAEKWVMSLNDITLYDKNGNELLGANDFAGGAASETEGFARSDFALPVDVSEIAGVRAGGFTFGIAE